MVVDKTFFIRLAKRRAYWQPEKVAELVVDFHNGLAQIDTTLSLFKSGTCPLVQLSAEFSASTPRSGRATWVNISPYLDGMVPILVPSETAFSNLNQNHYELQADAETISGVINRIREAILSNSLAIHENTPKEMVDFACQEIRNANQEWIFWQSSEVAKRSELLTHVEKRFR